MDGGFFSFVWMLSFAAAAAAPSPICCAVLLYQCRLQHFLFSFSVAHTTLSHTNMDFIHSLYKIFGIDFGAQQFSVEQQK